MLGRLRNNSSAWPEELRFNQSTQTLALTFDDGFKGEIPFELLRVESPSAETKGHAEQTPAPPAGKRNVNAISADAVGDYAVRIGFDDGHDTGFYTWPYLYDLAANQKSRMKSYLKRLKEAGLSRE